MRLNREGIPVLAAGWADQGRYGVNRTAEPTLIIGLFVYPAYFQARLSSASKSISLRFKLHPNAPAFCCA